MEYSGKDISKNRVFLYSAKEESAKLKHTTLVEEKL